MTDPLWPTIKGAVSDNYEHITRHDSATTVLPSPLATLVSFVTSASSFGLRVGGYFGSAAINGARIGTLTTFELGRVIIEGVLTRAGNDVVQNSVGEQGRNAAEGLLERALSTLHYSITQTSFLISAGFQVGSTSLNSSLAVSQFFLSGLDAILGDTETSKAVATIVSLVRREFKNPETGIGDEQVGLGDLLVGITSFALLQRWEAARTEQELKDAGVTETVWDIVIISDERISNTEAVENEVDSAPILTEPAPLDKCSASFVSATGQSESFDAIQDQTSLSSTHSSQGFHDIFSRSSHPIEESFRRHLASQLKPGSSVQLIAESRVADRIEIQVRGDADADIQPPSGFILLAVDRQTQWDGTSTFIFHRSQRKRRRGSFGVDAFTVEPEDAQQSPEIDIMEASKTIDANDGPQVQSRSHISDFPNPDDSVEEKNQTSFEDNIDQDLGSEVHPRPSELSSAGPIAANQKRPRSPLTHHSSLSNVPGVENSPLRKAMSKSRSVKNLVDFWSRERQRPLRSSTATAARFHSFNPGPTFGKPSSAVNASHSAFRIPERDSSLSYASPAYVGPQDGPTLSGPELRPTSSKSHHRNRSSSYSIASVASDTSLMLRRLSFDDYSADCGSALRRDASIPGQYPRQNFASNISRFARYSLTSYGSKFLRLTGSIPGAIPTLDANKHLPQHHSFSYYNNLPPSTILLSSYVDSQGSRTSTNEGDSGMPLVYYVTLDHESKAVVLTCRGTLGFEDILTDMTAEYTSITWQSQTFQAHQGVYASAKRLLQLDNQRILTTIKIALEEFDDYGLVLCGHSLGGAVAAMLGIFLSQKNTTSAGGAARFVTCGYSPHIGSLQLPPNRPIHAYAYGPAACVSPALQRASRGLVTTIVHRDDIVPYLSLGTLRDFQAIAWVIKIDTTGAKGEVRRRVLASLMGAFQNRGSESGFSMPASDQAQGPKNKGWLPFASWWPYGSSTLEESEEDHWAWSALRSLRASLLADKLVPPGDVFLVDATPVLQRDAFVSSSPPDSAENSKKSRGNDKTNNQKPKNKSTNARNVEEMTLDNQDNDNDDTNAQPASARGRRSYKPATRLTVHLVRDVERRFREIRFSSGMFTDHFPGRYLEVLEELDRAIGT